MTTEATTQTKNHNLRIRERNNANGLVQIGAWVPKENAEEVYRHCGELRRAHLSGEPIKTGETAKISILWGRDLQPGEKAITYEFDSQAERDAFEQGIEAALGWTEWRKAKEGYIVPPPVTTADIGDAIRYYMEGVEIDAQNRDDDENPPGGSVTLDSVDITDPHNPMFHTDAGVFRVSIVRVG
jgi:hypothetical protein